MGSSRSPGNHAAGLARHIALSQRVAIDDLNWTLARAIGLTPRERACLEFFADVESQTVYYFLELARLEVARDPELLAFLTLWNYEEYFHAHAIARLLEACGAPPADATARPTRIRAAARTRARVEDAAQRLLARLAPRPFVALWMVWGALQECLTAHAYDELAHATENPVLAELCRRIAKQERRHFAFYFEQARARLAGRAATQRFCRAVVEAWYAPVGSGVKRDAEVAALVAALFPGARLLDVMREVERRLSQLPGLAGLSACTRWARGLRLPAAPPGDPPARASHRAANGAVRLAR